MKLMPLALKSLWNRRLSVGLTIFAIAISVALLLCVERVRIESKRSFTQTVSGVDLIVGARGGSTQLLLYSVFRLGEASADFSWQSFELIRHHPKVAWAIPVALGDSHHGYRVLATDQSYFEHYQYAENRGLVLAQGTPFHNTFDVVLGSDVARKLGYQLNQKIVLSHGIGQESLHDHEDKPYTVVGILAPTGTPVDKTLHITLAGMEGMHEEWQNGVPPAFAHEAHEDHDEHGHEAHEPSTITAAFVGLKNRLAVFQFQRSINTYQKEPLMAVLPGVALAELWQSFSLLEQALLLVSGCVVGAGLLGMLAVMLTTLNERRREMAILRAIGARPRHVFSLLLLESLLLGLGGVLLGLLIFHALLLGLRPWLAQEFGLFLPFHLPSAGEWRILGAVVLAACATGLLPAVQAYRNLLADGLSIRV